MEKVNITKICWNITQKCNRHCKHCFRFTNSEDLSIDENLKILDILKENGTKRITWTGGEATLYKNIEFLITKSKEIGILNNLITNSTTLTPKIFKDKFSNIDSITFSLDFISDEDNIKFGRGKNYFQHLKEMIIYINSDFPNIDVKINTVINRENINILESIYNEIKDFKIIKWKLIKFVSFRGTAYKNKNKFSTTTDDFIRHVDLVKSFGNDCKFEIETVTTTNLENNHIMIKPNGDLVKTIRGIDKLLFNILEEGDIK